MIIYELACPLEHRFEGWFRSAQDYEQQAAQGRVSCPHCGSGQVSRIPSGLHVAQHGSTLEPLKEKKPESSGEPPVPPAGLQTLYRNLVDALVTHTDDVGSEFAAEARRIHYDEAPARPIRGQASQDDFDALQDEGIDVFRLPLPAKEVLN
ncbi:MAG TPA: DUF1178 family protein [Azospira sp.]|nr:DUF1178 family protein [Azospira sp.]